MHRDAGRSTLSIRFSTGQAPSAAAVQTGNLRARDSRPMLGLSQHIAAHTCGRERCCLHPARKLAGQP